MEELIFEFSCLFFFNDEGFFVKWNELFKNKSKKLGVVEGGGVKKT